MCVLLHLLNLFFWQCEARARVASFWAPVSEPGFLDFHIFRFSILEILFLRNVFEKYVGEISRNK